MTHHEHYPTGDSRLIDRLNARIAELNEQLETREGEAYQIIGNIAHYTGLFEHPEIIRALDWFAYPEDRKDDILPWPAKPLRPSPDYDAQRELIRQMSRDIQALRRLVEEKNRTIEGFRACRNNEERD